MAVDRHWLNWFHLADLRLQGTYARWKNDFVIHRHRLAPPATRAALFIDPRSYMF